jgi:hypothetical protein
MTAIKRNKTNYPGIFFREGQRLGGCGIGKIYYTDPTLVFPGTKIADFKNIHFLTCFHDF